MIHLLRGLHQKVAELWEVICEALSYSYEDVAPQVSGRAKEAMPIPSTNFGLVPRHSGPRAPEVIMYSVIANSRLLLLVGATLQAGRSGRKECCCFELSRVSSQEILLAILCEARRRRFRAEGGSVVHLICG